MRPLKWLINLLKLKPSANISFYKLLTFFLISIVQQNKLNGTIL